MPIPNRATACRADIPYDDAFSTRDRRSSLNALATQDFSLLGGLEDVVHEVRPCATDLLGFTMLVLELGLVACTDLAVDEGEL